MQRCEVLLTVLKAVGELEVLQSRLLGDLNNLFLVRNELAIVFELLFLPIEAGDLLSCIEIFDNDGAKATEFTAKRNLLAIESSVIEPVRFF